MKAIINLSGGSSPSFTYYCAQCSTTLTDASETTLWHDFVKSAGLFKKPVDINCQFAGKVFRKPVVGLEEVK
jgi:hypothetical protein